MTMNLKKRLRLSLITVVLTIDNEVDGWMGKPYNCWSIIRIITCPESSKKRNSNKYKKELKIKGWSRDGRAKKYTNKIHRDNQIHYTSLRLLAFLNIIMRAPIVNNIMMLVTKCYYLGLEASIGMYGGCDYPSKSCFLALPSLLH